MEESLIGKDNIFPANQIFHFSGGYIFKHARASLQAGSSNCAGLLIFNVPRDTDHERPGPVSTVYFYQSTEYQ